MRVKRTIVDLDEHLLAEATLFLRVESTAEAVNEALCFLATEKRRQQVDAIKFLGDWFSENQFGKDAAWR